MPVQLSESAALEEAVALIRLRIKEKRLYEAKFLCRQWRDAADAELAVLATTIAGHLERVDNYRLQAREAMAIGQYAEAGRLFAAVEAIALDVPCLAEEKQAITAAETLLAPPPAQPTPGYFRPPAGRVAEESTPPASVAANEAIPTAVSPTVRRRKTEPVSWLIGGGLVLLGLAAGLLWYFWAQESVPPLPEARNQALAQPDIPAKGLERRLQPTEPPTAPPTPPPESGEPAPTLPAAAVMVPPSPEARDQVVAPVPPAGGIESTVTSQQDLEIPDAVTPTLPATPKRTAPPATTPAPGLKLGTLQIQPAPKK